VHKRYPPGVDALRGVDLEVREGETVALIGESGSGKSTLLRLFNRLVEPTRGEVALRGEPIRARDPILLRRQIGYVQQEGGLLPHWTVGANVALVPRLQGWDPGRIRERVDSMLRMVGLPAEEYADRYPRRLSGGQRQRVAIARALAADPDVVLLDEPFGALDPITRAGLQEEFRELKRALNKTVLLVTHDIEEAFFLADRIAVIHAGRIEQVGFAAQLSGAPATPYVERLLSRARRSPSP
jgi:osmoprotectant transport system ATP-binding protein